MTDSPSRSASASLEIHHRLLAASYRLLEWPLLISEFTPPPNELRVLLYHDIPAENLGTFARQLRWLARRWDFVSPKQFEAMMAGEEAVCGRKLLLTFDDGYASNRIVADTVLADLGISAIFFVVSDFVGIAADDVEEFIRIRMFPGEMRPRIDRRMTNMRWSDLEALLERGHSIGSHTMTHARLSVPIESLELRREIVESADRLERRLGVRIEHFAFPFGDVRSVTPEALALAQGRYRFIMSAVRGSNLPLPSPAAIRRDSIDPDYPDALVGAFMHGLADGYYRSSCRILDRYVRTAASVRPFAGNMQPMPASIPLTSGSVR